MLPEKFDELHLIAFCPYRSAVCAGKQIPEQPGVQEILAQAISASHIGNHSVVVYTLHGDAEIHVLGYADNLFYLGSLDNLKIFDWFMITVFDAAYTEQLMTRKFEDKAAY